MSSSVMILRQPTRTIFHSHPFVIGLIYMIVVLLVLLPWGSSIHSALIGYWGTDTIDTLNLRWFLFHPDAFFFPSGFNSSQLTPNFIDHLSAFPLTTLFPFPLADNLWWIIILWVNALSAHWMGRVIGNNHSSGWICGITLLCSEYILREVNWGHAPQVMVFPALFCITLIVRWYREQDPQDLRLGAIFLGLSGWCYFYFVPFVLVLIIPILCKSSIKDTIKILSVAGLVLLPNILWLVWISTPMLTTPNPPLIDGKTLTFLHSGEWNWIWARTPIDISNQQSIIGLLGCLVGAYNARKNGALVWMGILGLVVGGVLLMGERTPMYSLIHSIPPMSRLLWPERWGVLCVIGTLVLLSQAPRFIWFLPFLMIEMTIRSENLPLHTENTTPFQCVQPLQNVEGAILELPLQDGENLYNIRGLRQRIHQRPLVNPFILPPSIAPPTEWELHKNDQWLTSIDGKGTTIDLDQIVQTGVSIIMIDKVLVPMIKQRAIIKHLEPFLGEPTDLGCAWIWHTENEEFKSPSTEQIPRIRRHKPSSIQKPL